MKKNDTRYSKQNEEAELPQQLRIHPKAAAVLDKYRGHEILDSLKKAFDLASSISDDFKECTHFSLLDAKHIDELGALDTSVQAEWFWREMNLLLVLLTRTSAKSILCSIDGIAWALGSRNELLLALSTRALLEHAAGLGYLSDRIAAISERLTREIWPRFRSKDNSLLVTEGDRKIRDTLLRFAVGRVAEVKSDNIPSVQESSAAWKAYSKGMNDIPKHLTAVRIGEMIDVVAQTPGRQVLGPVYKLLSEYCHPNSASRTLDFDVTMNDDGRHHITVPVSASVSAGFMRVLDLCRFTIPIACDVASEGLNALVGVGMPMTKELMGTRLARPMSQRVVDSHGRMSWISVGQIAHVRPKVSAVLSPEQKQRVLNVREQFKSACDDPIEKWIDDVACEGPNAEAELQLWEHLASVYQRELNDRGDLAALDRKVLYHAVVQSSNVPSAADFLVTLPNYSGYPDLERVVARVHRRIHT